MNTPTDCSERGNRTALHKGAEAEGRTGVRGYFPFIRRNAARPLREVATHSRSSAGEQTSPKVVRARAGEGEQAAKPAPAANPGDCQRPATVGTAHCLNYPAGGASLAGAFAGRR